jgi:CDP-glycerol glycerophosphotransferase
VGFKVESKINKLRGLSFFINKLARRVLMVILVLPLHIVYYLSGYMPRRDSKWVFSSWKGMAIRGNSKYLFEYVSGVNDIDAVWVTKSKDSIFKLFDSKMNIKYGYSVGGMYALMSAKVIFVSHGLNDVVPYFTRGALVVNLGHTTYPIKNMSFYSKVEGMSFLYRLYSFIISPYDFVDPSYEIVASKSMMTITMFLDLSNEDNKKKIVPLGSPKTDHLIKIDQSCRDYVVSNVLSQEPFLVSGSAKIVMFFPTWRKNEEYNLFDHNFDASLLDRVLLKYNAFIAINFHPFDANIRERKSGKISDRIYSISYGGDDIAQLLCAADVFITDYSSLFADFILFDRPIIFSKFAYDDYLKERVLSVEYDHLPGNIVKDWKELISVLEGHLANNKDVYCEARRAWRYEIYSETDDGKSSERIYAFIKDVLC